MTRNIPFKKEPHALSKNYAQKAAEFYESMLQAIADKRWNAASSLAIHVAISITDAVLVKQFGLRSTGQKHGDAAHLLAVNLGTEEGRSFATALGQLLSKKSLAEYDNRLITAKEAGNLVREAERYYIWAKGLYES